MRIELWPEGAPLAMGNGTEDRPVLNGYVLEKGSRGEPSLFCREERIVSERLTKVNRWPGG